ncbi:MAG: aminoacyl-tRNA hydrolase [Candidatus Saccharimonadales bacterium]
MALLQRKPQTDNVPLYRVGNEKTYLVIGLGNPGKDYDGTRHNIGFVCVDNLAQKLDFPAWTAKKSLKCLESTQTVSGNRVILIKPTTFMNLSGEAVQAVSHFYKLAPSQMLAVYDELDIPFGQIRTRIGGGSAGHNGVKSLIEYLGEEFGRVRVGTANKISEKADSAAFVLDKFTKDEQAELPHLLQEANSIMSEYIYSGNLRTETRSFLL